MTDPEPAAPGLRVGYVPGVILRKWWDIWAERLPGVPLEIVEVAELEQRSVLEAGPAGAPLDFVFARLPVDTEGVHAIRLYDEVTVAWASKDHPIALFERLTLADLDGERVLTEVTPRTIDQVADADAVLRVPLSVARAQSRRDLIHRPIADAEATTIALIWLRDNANPLLEDFIGIVRGRTANSSRSPHRTPSAGASDKPKADRTPDRASGQPRRGLTAGNVRKPRPPRPGGRRRG